MAIKGYRQRHNGSHGVQEVCGHRCVGKNVNIMSQCLRTSGAGHTRRKDRGEDQCGNEWERDKLKHRHLSYRTQKGRRERDGSRGSKTEKEAERDHPQYQLSGAKLHCLFLGFIRLSVQHVL